MLLPRAFDSCKNRSSRNTGFQKHTQASKQLVDVRGRVRKYPENRASNSVGQIILLPQHSNCWTEVNVNMTNELQHSTGLLALNSARHRALTYTAESAGLPEEAQELGKV